jgi:hypothetical protein
MGNVFDVLYTVSIFEYIRKYGFNFLGGWAGAWSCISKVIVKEFKIYLFYTYIPAYLHEFVR